MIVSTLVPLGTAVREMVLTDFPLLLLLRDIMTEGALITLDTHTHTQGRKLKELC